MVIAGCLCARAYESKEIIASMQKVADWQLANPSRHPATDWTQGAGYAGMMALAGISADSKYLDAMVAMGTGNHWQLGPKPYYADDHCVGQAYAELALKFRNPEMIAPMKARFDHILSHPRDSLLVFKIPGNQDRWSWCDALFMAPPAWAKLYRATGNPAYLDFMIREWDACTGFLYDKEAHLYFRDSTYFEKREANGKKVFWGRGNGWVMAGLVRVLQEIPGNHPQRERFEQQFKDMCRALLACQQADGMWRASLLDPASYPLRETSSTGFYTYAFAWGVNQGLLDSKSYTPAVEKAWAALSECVDGDGKLTHVQPIGADPQRFPDDSTEVYGTGAFLLAGSEIYRMAVLSQTKPHTVSVTNPAAFHRMDETVEVGLAENAGPMAVMDAPGTRILDSQRIGNVLLFKVDLAPGETRKFLLLPEASLCGVPRAHPRTFCRFVPERMDDFAWESDVIGYRAYGPGLVTGEGTVCSGIDVWVKRKRKLVIDRWYAGGDYHKDHGEGLDYYKVAYPKLPTRGCGGVGIWDGKQLYVSGNFSKQRVLVNGPLRSVFELTYDAWDAGGRMVSEVRKVSMDAGSRFSHVESLFSTEAKEALSVGIGIARRKGGEFRKYQDQQLMAYWEPEIDGNGHTGCAVIVPGGLQSFAQDEGNFLAIAQAEPGEPLAYRMGAGWDRSGDYANYEDWLRDVHRERQRMDRPLVVTLR